MLLCAQGSIAQELQYQVSKNAYKLNAEKTAVWNNHLLYAYSELAMYDTFSSYTQIFYEYKFKPTSIHLEYRSFMSQGSKSENSFLLGVSQSVVSNDNVYLSIAPLYRYEKKHMWQLSAVYGCSYKNLAFDGYFDFYGDNKLYAFSENKLKVYISDTFVGINVEYSLMDEISRITPYIMIGFRF